MQLSLCLVQHRSPTHCSERNWPSVQHSLGVKQGQFQTKGFDWIHYELRLARAAEATTIPGDLEILRLSGTL